MSTPIDYIYNNQLQWQPALKGALNVAGRFGYRGELALSADQMPPKLMLKHAIVISDETTTLLFAAQLEDFDHFKSAFALYKEILSPTTIVTLFVDNIISDCAFEYEGVTIYAYALDESSVWNELISHADLDKKELKRMDAEDKLDALYDALKGATLFAKKMSFDEACALRMN